MNLVDKMSVRVISLNPLHRTLELTAIAIQGIVIVNCAILYIAKTQYLLVKSRLALGSLVWLFVRQHTKNGLIHRSMVVDCPVITSICETLFKTRQGESLLRGLCIVMKTRISSRLQLPIEGSPPQSRRTQERQSRQPGICGKLLLILSSS